MSAGRPPEPARSSGDAPWTTAAPEAAVERALTILDEERRRWTSYAEVDEGRPGVDHAV
jgi:hypothetical protein